ncbi:MAG: carboxypeptidase-like regulatory domain-containing protein, partial [Planctomycetota bacterium]
EQSHPDDVFEDATWPRPGSAGYDTTSTGSAQQSNCSLVKNGVYYQPCLKLGRWGGSGGGGGGGGGDDGGQDHLNKSSSARYGLYYNVYRELDGGVENFGYTVKTGSEATRQHEYVAKGDGRIRVSVCSLSTEELPSVALAASNGPSGNNESSPGEFTVDARQGVPYTLSISNNTEHEAVWGYVTLREEPPTGVRGRVVAKTPDRPPLPGVEIRVGSHTTTTDANGHYRIELPRGEYTVIPGHVDGFWPANPGHVKILGGMRAVNFTLTPTTETPD